jgi:IS605 OrfB family transposase
MPARSWVRRLCWRPKKKINLTFRIDDHRLRVTLDPDDLPNHPEQRRPALRMKTRAVGLGLNPGWIGIAAVENVVHPARLDETRPLDWALVELAAKPGLSRESVTEMLARVRGRAIAMARQSGAVEEGLGKLRSTDPARDVNRTINYWARTRLIAMLRRKANLAGITVIEVRGAYSTMIGNLTFEAPDARAPAMEIARRGIAAGAKLKDLLPVFDEGWRDGLRKDLALPAEAEGWEEVHRAIKAAKIGVRRPHPRLTASDPGGRPSPRHCGATAWPTPTRRAHCPAGQHGSSQATQFGKTTSVGFESNAEIRIVESGKTWRLSRSNDNRH